MKTKTYVARIIEKPETYYFVDAPNKRIARWCGANLCNNEYCTFLTSKDIRVERFIYKEVKQND